MELYVHIPFCVQKCKYCDFLSGNYDVKLRERYTYALISEIESFKDRFKDETITSVYIGGGTPTYLEVVFMQRILDAIFTNFNISKDAEISMECNPGTGSLEAFKIYRHLGVNRLSIGLQSANDDELELLGRVHDYAKFDQTYREAQLAGFDNINVDLMSGLPFQTWNKLSNTLKKVVKLKPQHISLYSLIIEEGTEFYEKYGEDVKRREKDLDTIALPDLDDEYELLQNAKDYLEEAGYHQYEISNFAKEGKECKHNIGYWKRVPYLGVGLGAASFIDAHTAIEDNILVPMVRLIENPSYHTRPAKAALAAEEERGELSEREIEILVSVAQGLLNKEIADRHNISINTVITHRKNITRKTGIKTVAGLTVYAILNGYVDINSVK